MGKETLAEGCALCGLPRRSGRHRSEFGGRVLDFCCKGCLMVYTMLMEAADSPDPSTFQQSELFRRCVAAGVVPSPGETSTGDGAVSTSPETAGEVPDGECLSLQLQVEGMWCPACAWVIETALSRLDGVEQVACDFATDRLRCRYDPVQVTPETIAKTIGGLGYRSLDVQGKGERSLWVREFVRLMVSGLLSANVMMLSWSLYSGFFASLTGEGIRYISWPMLVMTTVVMVYGGGPLFRKAWWGIRVGAPGMEALVCLGAGTAYLFSLYNFRQTSWHLYFDTASMLITLVLLGKLLESKAKVRVRRDLAGFLALQPNKVRLCNDRHPQGRFVALAQLAAGDRFRVKDGEMVPADGRVVAGHGLVDESAVTGESRPKSVAPGQSMTSGTRLIKGDVRLTAERVGGDALLGQMVAIIESALSRRTPLESRTDQWLSWFVPAMVGLAAATAVFGYLLGLAWEAAFIRALTVLVIACPCALGIAIPLARIAGMSAAGRAGILVRDFEAFERGQGVDCVVLDKTGTLTHGQWSLEKIEAADGMGEAEALALAAGLESGVDHAVARAVLAHAAACDISPAEVQKVKLSENGVEGKFEGKTVKIGTWAFVADDSRRQPVSETKEGLLSRVFLGLDGHPCATLGFGDRLRPSSAGLIGELQRRGHQVHLISGDTPAATRQVAAKLGIETFQGGLLPSDKAAYVGDLQSGGQSVIMVGDGINDAPALARADLSVAVHRDAALAQQAAQVTLMRGDPAQLIDFSTLAGQVNAKVMQNLGCAWIYNLISIPIAMSGLLNPLVAATAMLLSSLTVIGNTLLLVRNHEP
ncbi:MAG: heavy metal translocating P-type ATPase [Desulfobacteraceae bacterium]